jgi:hypothetical protein
MMILDVVTFLPVCPVANWMSGTNLIRAPGVTESWAAQGLCHAARGDGCGHSASSPPWHSPTFYILPSIPQMFTGNLLRAQEFLFGS